MGEIVPPESTHDETRRTAASGATDEAALYERYAARVYYVALRGCGSRQDAEDVRAEVFLRVVQALRSGQLRSNEALTGFVLGVTRNVLHELYTRRRRATDPLPEEGEAVSVSSHERHFLDRDVIEAVDATIRQLKPRDRAVLRLHFYEELPTAEIARRIGVAAERVRLVKSRALQRFRELHQRKAAGR